VHPVSAMRSHLQAGNDELRDWYTRLQCEQRAAGHQLRPEPGLQRQWRVRITDGQWRHLHHRLGMSERQLLHRGWQEPVLPVRFCELRNLRESGGGQQQLRWVRHEVRR